MKENKWIQFDKIGTSPSGKTGLYAIVNKSSGRDIGHISWYSQWRQYTFDPNYDTIWNAGCLRSVMDFLNELNVAQKG